MAGKSDTWMPLYIGDYLADTMHLTTRQYGAYMLLLMHAWRSDGYIPASSEAQAAIVRMPVKEWLKDQATIASFFDDLGEKLYHGRVGHELDVAHAMMEQRSRAGKASAAKRERERQQKANENSTPVEQALPPRTKPSPSPSQSNSEANASGGEPPDDPVKALWDDGVRLLTAHGSSERNARSKIGDWRKRYTDERTHAGIKAAREQAVSEPIGWITKWLKAPSNAAAPRTAEEALSQIEGWKGLA